jgi:hypothetical protein
MRCVLGLGNFLLLLFAVVSVVPCVAGQDVPETVFAIDLRHYGWEPPDRLDPSGPLLVIDHKGRVLVGFTVRERTGLVTRDQPSLDFHILRFTPDGKVDLSLSLPTDAKGITGIYLSDTDQIIARANASLQLLPVDDPNMQGQTWRHLVQCDQRCSIKQSITRRTLHLYTPGSDPPSTLIRLSQGPSTQPCGKSKKLIGSNDDQIQNYPESITDTFAYFSLDGETFRWPLCLYEDRTGMPIHIQGAWFALSDALFVLNTPSRRKGQTDGGLKVVSADGEVKFQPRMMKDESALNHPRIRGNEGGDRIAVDIVTSRGGIPTLDVGSHVTARRIAVYDIGAGKEVASGPAKASYNYRFEFDLSPDGHRLAILEDNAVKLVDLQGTATPVAH